MTDAEAKQQWTGANHLERWQHFYGQWVTSGTEINGSVFLKVDLTGCTPFQQDQLMFAYSRACAIEGKPVDVSFV